MQNALSSIEAIDLSEDIKKLLGAYVYLYVDPRNNQVFYIGKGKGNRLLQHLWEEGTSEKNQRSEELKAIGEKPRIELLRYSLSESEARLVEAAAIDLIGKTNLTNQVRGGDGKSYGRMKFEDLMKINTAKPVTVRHRALAETINKLYRSDMSDLELYEATRGIWKVGKRREHVEVVMAVFQGIVREVYRPHQWYPAGTTDYETRTFEPKDTTGRWEFIGEVACDVRGEYIDFSIGKGTQNPIRYFN